MLKKDLIIVKSLLDRTENLPNILHLRAPLLNYQLTSEDKKVLLDTYEKLDNILKELAAFINVKFPDRKDYIKSWNDIDFDTKIGGIKIITTNRQHKIDEWNKGMFDLKSLIRALIAEVTLLVEDEEKNNIIKKEESNLKKVILDKLNRYKVFLTLGILVIAFLTFFGIKPQSTARKTDSSKLSKGIDIILSNFNPVFITNGQKMNWGGGSQALFANCNSNTSNKKLNKCDLWETLGYGSIQFNINAVYNASPNSPNCLIEEWGIQLKKSAETLKHGIFLNYNNIGGADAPINGGECLINSYEGQFPISMWYQNDHTTDGKAFLKYMKPNDVLPFKITANISNDYVGLQNSNGIYNTDAVELRVYAKTRINKESKTIYSQNYIKLIIPDPNDEIDWHLNEISWDQIEENRKRTIQN